MNLFRNRCRRKNVVVTNSYIENLKMSSEGRKKKIIISNICGCLLDAVNELFFIARDYRLYEILLKVYQNKHIYLKHKLTQIFIGYLMLFFQICYYFR